MMNMKDAVLLPANRKWSKGVNEALRVVGGVLLLALVRIPSAVAAEDCTGFQKLVATAMSAWDDLDTQLKRFKEKSSVPQYDADVCTAATEFEDKAGIVGTTTSGDCDINHIAATFTLLRGNAQAEVTLFCNKPAAPTSSEENTSTSDFILPDSDHRLITEADVASLSSEDLRIARNEIYARRGRFFESDDLKKRFESFAWYHPYTWNPTLNAIEAHNIQVIIDAERRH